MGNLRHNSHRCSSFDKRHNSTDPHCPPRLLGMLSVDDLRIDVGAARAEQDHERNIAAQCIFRAPWKRFQHAEKIEGRNKRNNPTQFYNCRFDHNR